MAVSFTLGAQPTRWNDVVGTVRPASANGGYVVPGCVVVAAIDAHRDAAVGAHGARPLPPVGSRYACPFLGGVGHLAPSNAKTPVREPAPHLELEHPSHRSSPHTANAHPLFVTQDGAALLLRRSSCPHGSFRSVPRGHNRHRRGRSICFRGE